ncbi:chemotaxis protein CheA [candidate division KSB1 bacterium]|nr:chemotaxis protein CheA [candidate division KSB1 bacterium]
MDKFSQSFITEATELLENLENDLMELKDSPADKELIDSVFRAMHTIKGSAAMFGFEIIADFTHDIENIFELVRSGDLIVSPELIDLIFISRDQISDMLTEATGATKADADKGKEIIKNLQKFSKNKTEEALDEYGSHPEKMSIDSANSNLDKTYRIRFKPDINIFRTGTNPIFLIEELELLGTTKIICHTDSIPDLAQLDPESSYVYWDIIITTDAGVDAIKDVFIFVEDSCELLIETIDEGYSFENDSDYKKIGEILVSHGDITQEELNEALSSQQPIGQILVNLGKINPSTIAAAATEQEEVRKIRSARQQRVDVSSIRVTSEKLDRMVDLVGELVVAQARLNQIAHENQSPDLVAVAEEVERLSGELRDSTMEIRMLPIGTTFSKFKRLVYDLSKDLGKEVNIYTEGGETELDKNVIEKLNDPLIHIIRNCIDHGIEKPEVRKTAGKPQQGTVRISAIHSGSNVFIHIEDDGAGINKERIRQKAIEKGLIGEEALLSEKELLGLIMEAGFSTAQEITSVSGRGVGMDVVRRSIEDLRGSIEIDSTEGKGTHIIIQLPLTLAIIEGLQVQIGEDYFILPLSSVEECIELTNGDTTNERGSNLIHVRGEVTPYIRLRDWFGFSNKRTAHEQIVVTNMNNHRIGFVVDQVVGEHQTVIKSLGKVYENVEGISGATIRGDGTIALILDVPKLIEVVESEIKAA